MSDPHPSPRFLSFRTLAILLLVAGAAFALTRFAAPRPADLAAGAAASDRAAAPAFVTTTLDGRRWSLAEHRGQVVLLNFFATWCPPCRAEMPDLVDLAQAYQPKGVAVLGLSLDEGGAGVVQPFVQRYRLSFPVALADPSSEIAAGITGIPVTLLLDRSGRIARHYVGRISPEQVRADLDALLAEKP